MTRFLCSLGILALAASAFGDVGVSQVEGVSILERAQAFEESVDVQLVNVEVRVIDRKGRAIKGLTPDDFEVFEDRRPVEVLHFAELRQGRPTNSTMNSTTDTAERGSVLESLATIGSEPAHLVFYFDNSHLRPAGRTRAIADLRDLLQRDRIEPSRVLLIAQSPWIQSFAPFGSTKEALLEGLDALELTPAKGPEVDRQRKLLFDHLFELFESVPEGNPLGLSRCGLLQTDGVQEVQTHGQRVKARVGTTLRHLATLSSALAGISGPKSVLYFGNGLELVPIADPLHFLIEICPQFAEQMQRYSHRIDLTTRFQDLTRHANGNAVTFYTLDAGGLPLGSSSSVQYSDFNWKPSPLNDQIRRNNLQNSLAFMASDTGGRAIFNTNRLGEEILAIQDEAGSFYSLAYEPPHAGDGDVHMIDVKVKKKGARAQHRLSYRDKAADERMADRLQAALTLGIETNPMEVTLGRGPATLGATKRERRIPMWIKVPLSSLVFLSEEGGHVGRIRMQLAARDEQGRLTAFHQKHFEIQLDPSLGGRAQGEHTFVVDMTMRSGPHVVAVGLRDEIGREASFLASKVTVE